MSTLPMTPLRFVITFMASIALAATFLAATLAVAASPTECRVHNLDTGITKGNLQRAVKAARPGDRLTLRGTCQGSTTIGKSLTIRGVRTVTSGVAALDGAGRSGVLVVKARVTVTLRSVTVRRGAAPTGGGILNQGTLVLGDVVVRGNSAAYGGGVFNYGRLTLNGSSSIRANTALGPAGASGRSAASVEPLSPVDTLTPDSSGGGVLNAGTLTLNGSSTIRGNTTDAWGGGVLNGGTLTLNGSSAIRANSAELGGGIYDQGGTLVGVVCAPDPGANVADNTPDDCYLSVTG